MKLRSQAKTQRHKTSTNLSTLQRENAELRTKIAEQAKTIEKLERRADEAKEEARAWKERYFSLEERSRNEIALLNLQIKDLREALEQVKVTLTWHKKHTFGKRSEKATPEQSDSKYPKGKRSGAPGYGRKDRNNLYTTENVVKVPQEKRICVCCGKAYRKLGRGDRSKMIELVQELIQIVDVGEKYVKDCACDEGNRARIVSAEPPPRVFPRALLGPHLWTDILTEKFLLQKPLQKISLKYQLLGADVPVSTICSGLKKLDPLFTELYEQIQVRAKGAKQWNMDETTWRVFGSNSQSDKRRWWLWVVVTADCWVFMLDPKRSAEVPKTFFQGVNDGVLITDRYSAYKALMSSIQKAYCWAHVRRDFVNIRDGIEKLHDWAHQYVELISDLFKLNNERTSMMLTDADEQHDLAYYAVKYKLDEILRKCERDLKKPLHERQKKALNSLKKHWTGLTIFLDQPEVPMDNNAAERALRGPVTGRKVYLGSGSDWSGHFAAKMFSIFQTWLCNGLDPIQLLEDFLSRTAKTRGHPPPAEDYLPWEMDDERKNSFKLRTKR